jgi:hypothetical protein
MKNVIAPLIVALAVGGCAVNAGVGVRAVPRDVDDNHRVMFIELVKTVQINWNAKPTPQLRNDVERLAFSAGLHKRCVTDQCFLYNPDTRASVRVYDNYVYIEFDKTQYYKIDDPRVAADIVYR